MVASLKTLSSASSTAHYFENDRSYYVDGDAGDRWFGKGAKDLKLRGRVDLEDFETVLRGEVPGTDITLGRIVDGERVHRPGFDLTISAPKSVSVAALVLQDEAIFKAHDTAVRSTLEHIESGGIIKTRRWDPQSKRMQRVAADSVVAATFTHEASRALDPQLHTHCVFANMTKGDDGKWRSIESMERDKLYIGAYYRNELAHGLRELGYELRTRDLGGMPGFEIKGMPQHQLDQFSTRRADILKYIKDRGWSYNSTTAQIATLATRPKKIEMSRDQFRSQCVERGREMGIESPLPVIERGRSRDGPEIEGKRLEDDLHRAIRGSIEHMESRTSVFGNTNLKARVLGLLAGRVSVEQIEEKIFKMEEDGHLVRSTRKGTDIAWVTSETLRTERAMVKHMEEGKGKAAAIAPDLDYEGLFYERGLTEDQAKAVEGVLTSKDRVLGVQGYAGTGKTTMLGAMVDLAPDGHRFMGLAPSTAATFELNEAGIESRTLQYFLTRYGSIARKDEPVPEEMRREFSNTTLVLDESSMVSTRQMKALFDITSKLEVERVVLVGDKDQLRAVEAGQPFRQLQDHGMATAEVKQIVRQKDSGLKSAVEAVVDGNISLAMAEFASESNAHSRLVEFEREDLPRKAGEMWLALDPAERDKTLLIAQTHELRQGIHWAIREGLESEGALKGEEITHERLFARHMTPEQKRIALNYTAGDVLVFKPGYEPGKDDHYTVTEVTDKGRINIESREGHQRSFDPTKGNIRYNFDVYAPVEIDLRGGDKVRFTRNFKELGIKNGDFATIEKVNRKNVELRLHGKDEKDEGGEPVTLSRGHNAVRHLDHGYSITTHASQGKTADRVIAVLDSGIGHLADQQNFYVQISRGSREAVVLTDNAGDLAENLEQNTGERMTAMEAVGEHGHAMGVEPGKRPELGRGLDAGIAKGEEIKVDRAFLEMHGLEVPDKVAPTMDEDALSPERTLEDSPSRKVGRGQDISETDSLERDSREGPETEQHKPELTPEIEPEDDKEQVKRPERGRGIGGGGFGIG